MAKVTRIKRGLFALTLTILGAVLIMGCAQEKIAGDHEAPAVPQFVPRSSDTALVEEGIDAVPEGDFISLAWYPSPAEDLAGYRLYRRAEDSSETIFPDLIADLALSDLGVDTVYTYLDNHEVLATDSAEGFYYWITAYDGSGNESTFSPEAYYRLMDKAGNGSANVAGDNLIITWNYAQDPIEVDYFMVRLFRWVTNGWIAIWPQKCDVYYPYQVAHIGLLESGSYRCQVDVVGASSVSLPAGSEMAWEFNLP